MRPSRLSHSSLVLLLGLFALSAAGCSGHKIEPPRNSPPADPRAGTTVTNAVVTDQSADRAWAEQALSVLDTVDAAVADYHEATATPRGTLRYRQLQDSAYSGFRKALAANEALWPQTQRAGNEEVRDQFVFVLGNIGGFMNPTPDLYLDDTTPTLGDRIGRSLQNAVSNSAAVRPKLLRLAGKG